MKYENPVIPEGINTSKEHPLKEFSILLIGSSLLVVMISLVLGFGGSWLAGKIPFITEVKIANMYDIDQHTDDKNYPRLTEYLQNLTDQISKVQNLPDGMQITTHYVNNDTVNAFATLGGHIFIFRGLLEKLPNENTLVTLLSHEIAHVKYRHPIKSLGRGVVVSIAITAIMGSGDSQVMGDAGLLTILKFSREMEQQSDEEAMNTLNNIYGHLNGGAQLFEIFHKMKDEEKIDEPAEIFSSHPLDETRIENFSEIATNKGWKEMGVLTPLPDFFQLELEKSSNEELLE